MGFFSWLKSFFVAANPSRNIYALPGDQVDEVQEVVDTAGGPLKPNHLRRALRDGRLLPKQKPKVDPYAWRRPKKKRWMDRSEADRFFSLSFRTRNRDVRDLKWDEEQLERYGLPKWQIEEDVATALGLTIGQLRHYSIHRKMERTSHYVVFSIPKRGGGERLIHAPKQRLKAVQRELCRQLLEKLPVSDQAHGFCVGRSVATNARPHVKKRVLVKLDIQDCFPTIHFGRVRGLLIAYGYSYGVATTLALLMTESERQPVEINAMVFHVPVGQRVCVQGAPTSPWLCNAILMRMDRRLNGLAVKFGFDYTRYADDMTFSGDDPEVIARLISLVRRVVREEGFVVHPSKTRVLRPAQCQRVTGVVVNDQMGLSRTERRKLRAAIHQFRGDDLEREKYIQGKLAYLRMLSPDQAEPLEKAFAGKCAQGRNS